MVPMCYTWQSVQPANSVPFIVEGVWRLHQQAGPPLPGHPTGVPGGAPPRRRLPDPGALQGTVTPTRPREDVALRGCKPTCSR
jgi:hypothetical protein